ncbi:pumilio homolog 12-like [Olea europaea subsp. europaea]|uniref:Pumilio homolog 12-like n=1 Tax=Olea europaea subsp. europaea TaxID=158383 RepID=A0A8S0PDZ7_OLEEU|nr:pumilio homolog 12-like [Olea europaea subsp. europaea]
MEQRHSQNPNFSASKSPENQQNHRGEHPFSQRTLLQIPLNVNFQTSDQAIESAFSRLTLSQDFQAQHETSSSVNLPLRVDGLEAAKPVPFSLGFDEKQENTGELQQALFWAQAQSNDCGVNGPFSLDVQQNLNVGPEMMGIGKSRYLDGIGIGVNPLRLMEYQGHGVFDTFNDNHEYSFLHGNKPFIGTSPQYPNCLSSTNNFMNFSSRPSLCNNQHLYQWEEQLSIENLRGRIVSLAKDQTWSGILKFKLDEGLTLPRLEMVLSEVLEFLTDVITNQSGSQFLLKLFMVCNVEQRSRIILRLTRCPFQFINICLNSHGAKAIQKLLEKLNTPHQISLIVSALSIGAVALANDPSGHLVIQHCVKYLPAEYNKHLYQWEEQLSIENLRGRIVSLAKDQTWSGILKFKLDEGLTLPRLEMVLSEVLEFLTDVITNQSGSQFLLKLFMVCNVEQRSRIILRLTRCPFQFINICLNSHGAKAIQKLLEKLNTPHQISLIVSALSIGAVALANDPSGHLVIQHCVKYLPAEYNKILLNEIGKNCFVIATNKSGCCVMQSCMEHSCGELRERLIHNVVAYAVHLAEDPYGNYVVQHLLGMKIPEVTTDLVRQFEGKFLSLSFNKYASNVVEKFLETSGESHSRKIIIELISSPNASMLLVDPFGNFVIQSALSEAKGHVRDALLNLIQANVSSIRNNLYGKKILSCLEKKKLLLV